MYHLQNIILFSVKRIFTIRFRCLPNLVKSFVPVCPNVCYIVIFI